MPNSKGFSLPKRPEGLPEIQRGQGFRLSVQSEVAPAEEQVGTSPQNQASTPEPRVKSPEVGEAVERPSMGYKIRLDIAHNYKRLAVNRKQKLYEVMEEALLEYLDKHRDEL